MTFNCSGLPTDRLNRLDSLTRVAEAGGDQTSNLLADTFRGLSADDAFEIMQSMQSANKSHVKDGETATKISAFENRSPGPHVAALTISYGDAATEVEVRDPTIMSRLAGHIGPTEDIQQYKAPDLTISGIIDRYKTAGIELAGFVTASGHELTRIASQIKSKVSGNG